MGLSFNNNRPVWGLRVNERDGKSTVKLGERLRAIERERKSALKLGERLRAIERNRESAAKATEVIQRKGIEIQEELSIARDSLGIQSQMLTLTAQIADVSVTTLKIQGWLRALTVLILVISIASLLVALLR